MKKLIINFLGLVVVTLLLVILAVNANGMNLTVNQTATYVDEDPNDPNSDPGCECTPMSMLPAEEDPNDPGSDPECAKMGLVVLSDEEPAEPAEPNEPEEGSGFPDSEIA